MATNAEKSEETRHAIIESAVQIISEKGYSKTALEDIVKNIGMTRGAFYWHFKNKQDLLKSIEQHYKEQYITDYGSFPVFRSAYETIRSLIVHQIDGIFDDDRIAYAFIIRYRIEALTELTDLMDEQVVIDNLGVEQITSQIERGIEQGEFRPDVDPAQAALTIFTLIVGIENIHMLHIGDEEIFSVAHFVDAAIAFLDSLKK